MKYSFKECIIIDKFRTFIIAIFCFPFHIAIFLAGNCSSFGKSHIAHYTEHVESEQRWYILHIIAELKIGFRSIRFFTRRRFQFHNRQRQTIHKYNDVGTLFSIFDKRPLIDDLKSIFVRMFKVYQINHFIAHFLAIEIRNFYAVLQIVCKCFIPLRQTAHINIA